MFKLYDLDQIVQNKALLKAFTFSIENYDGDKILKIEKNQSATRICFFTNLDHNYVNFYNLLRQPFFPASVTILSRLGKTIMDSSRRRTQEQMKETAACRPLPFLRDEIVGETIIRYFRYKNIYFNSSRGVICRTKPNALLNRENARHVLIRYFKRVTSRGIYEEEVFKAVHSLFMLTDDSSSSINQIISSIKLQDNTLFYRSLFVVDEENGMLPVNYGSALHASYKGLPVMYGNLDWSTFLKKKDASDGLAEPIDLSSTYDTFLQEQQSKFEESRENLLTSAASAHYNESIPDLVYWNA